MPRVVAENERGQILQHPEEAVLELWWRGDGEPMSDGAFMTTLSLLALMAERLWPVAILIDATRFAHRFGEGISEWRDSVVIPRYGAAGVRRFAFIMPEGFPGIGTQETQGPAVFPTAWFGSRAAAIGWLTGE